MKTQIAMQQGNVRCMREIGDRVLVQRGSGRTYRLVPYILESELDPLLGVVAVRHEKAHNVITVALTDLVLTGLAA